MNFHQFLCPCHYKYKIFVKKVACWEESNLWEIRVEDPRQDDSKCDFYNEYHLN